MNHIRTYHYYWYIFFFSLLVCMAEFTKAADRDVLERVIYLAKSKGTVYTLLGKVSEQSGFLFVYDSKVVDNDRTVKLGGQDSALFVRLFTKLSVGRISVCALWRIIF